MSALAVVVALPFPADTFSAHLAQHLVVGMAGPLLLVLGRPVTLALRAWRGRRALVRALRGATLVLAGAAHGILAKTLYADGFRAGAQVLYYGGDAVEIALALVVCPQWYRRQSRRRARATSVDTPVTAALPAPRTLEASTVAQSK
ncbi:cytochrome c oxidase assembly protein [Amycolatopsis thermoflava]|uniref:cytochrome c oxidase assembly protein n=1 Tax=Amycolatopsis thermoflava TaxID=84480 RepID=UPI003656148E